MSGGKIYRKPSRSRRLGIFLLMLALFIFQVTIFVCEKLPKKGKSSVIAVSEPFCFDPNSISLDSLCMLGLSQRQAQTILNYRSKGGRFRKAEDFSRMYVVSEELFLRLRPFIVIPSENLGTKQGQNVPKLEKSECLGTKQGQNVPKFEKTECLGTKKGSNVPKFEKSGGLGTKQGQNVPKFEKSERLGTKKGSNVPKLEKSGGLGTKQAQNVPKLEKSAPKGAKLMMVELNEADSATLVTLYGIGPFYAKKIIRYRERLGGFHTPHQLMEIPGIDSARFGGVVRRVTADPLKIKRFRLDSAGKHFLINHPYIGAYAARGIILMREKLGKESCTLENLVKERVISNKNAERLWPYME